jgi:hypothetical protein
MTMQYDARRDRHGWTVFDRWTGQSVVLDRALQSGLAWPDAEMLLDRLNRPTPGVSRNILQ